jgi:hypothetical protein
MSLILWTPFCLVQKTPHPVDSSFCPYCGATNSNSTAPIVDLTGSSPVPIARTTTAPIAEATREAANQRIRAHTATDVRPHSGQSMTIGRRLTIPAPPRTNGRQPQTQHIQAFYPVSVTLVEEPWEYLSMEDKENDKPTMIERSITGI